MYLCYVDESGVPQIPGNTSHYVLCGISIPAIHWKRYDRQIATIKEKWELSDQEMHTAWMIRPYIEQSKIPGFDKLDRLKRRVEANKYRKADLLKLQQGNQKRYHQQKKNYAKTGAYTHLTFDERKAFIAEVADTIGSWDSARLFAEGIDKVHFDPLLAPQPVEEQAFEQVVSRFEHYLQIMATTRTDRNMGLIIHDNNQTSCKRMTELMTRFHRKGTFWTKVGHIIETPLFVDSKLTSMVQVADICRYALRRYLENGEEDLFRSVFLRADRKDGKVVGVRHFSDKKCRCLICSAH